MQRKWREWLSNRLYDDWLENGHHRRLRFMLGEHQTPEYRIAEDARVATDLPVDLVLGLLSSLLTAVTFIGVLWSDRGHRLFNAADGSDDDYRPPPYARDAGKQARRSRIKSGRSPPARKRGRHGIAGWQKRRTPHNWYRVGRGNCTVVGSLLAAHADDAGFPHEHVADADCRVAHLRAKILPAR